MVSLDPLVLLADALAAIGADVDLTVKPDGTVKRLGVLSFPDLTTFDLAVQAHGFKASYSAGMGWTFRPIDGQGGLDITGADPCLDRA